MTFSGAANVTAEIDQSLVFIPLAQKGEPGGVATLDDGGKVPEEQLPEMNYEPAGSVEEHNTDPTAHEDIREELDGMLTAQIQVTYNGGGD